jgi:predicted histone-like DNA-binding protein
LPPNLTRLLILEIDDSPEIHRILLSKLLASASPKFLSLKGKKIMTVKYSIVERGNPQDQAAPKKFYPSLQSSGRKTLRELSKRITQMCTVSSPDTLAVIESMLVVIPEELAAGNIVELGDFGSFWLRSSSEGADEEDKVSASQVTNLLPRFNPGKEFKKALSAVEFEKISQA